VIVRAGEVVGRVRLDGGPVSMSTAGLGTYFSLIGRLFPSDAPEGAVLFVPKSTTGQPPKRVLEQLRRPTDTVVADLNQDGRDDLVVCQYGNRLGQFSWFENTGRGRYEEHVLLDRPGAVQTAVRDGERTDRVTLVTHSSAALDWRETLRTADSKDEQASSGITRRRWKAGRLQKGPIVVASRRVAC